MRKLASIQRIAEIRDIPEADRIVAYRVGGWWLVDQRNAYQVGNLVVYCEVDSWIPTELAPFLSKGNEPREFNGVKGERLRTIRLRGQISQGLILPVSVFGEVEINFFNEGNRWAIGVIPEGEYDYKEFIFEGDDVTERLGIQKWDAPIPAQLAGVARGAFPGFIPKTDQERVQNLTAEYSQWLAWGLTWEVTEKLDGSSMTVYVYSDDEGVCSRNLDLLESDTNSLWRVARRENLIVKIRSTGRNLALQGELVGEGIQGNRYAISGQDFRLFDIYDIDRGEYLAPAERRALAEELGIPHVPVLSTEQKCLDSVEDILALADGASTANSQTTREGLVFKSKCGQASFKAISNAWLLKNG